MGGAVLAHVVVWDNVSLPVLLVWRDCHNLRSVVASVEDHRKLDVVLVGFNVVAFDVKVIFALEVP